MLLRLLRCYLIELSQGSERPHTHSMYVHIFEAAFRRKTYAHELFQNVIPQAGMLWGSHTALSSP